MSEIKKLRYYKPNVGRGNRRNNQGGKKSPLKTVLLVLLGIVAAVVLAALGLILFLTVTEFKPAERETIAVEKGAEPSTLSDEITLMTWNIGYCGLGKYEDFVMDGGKTDGSPDTKEIYLSYLSGVIETLKANPADICIMQEVDVNSDRSYHYDEVSSLRIALEYATSAFAYNYKVNYVPFPWPPIGHVEGGVATFSKVSVSGNTAERIALPNAFSWPMRICQLKRCVLVTHYDIEGSDRKLAVVNFHLEAYDSGEGNLAQARRLLEILNEEYEKGNYVIAGGDFNQAFPGSLEVFPIKNEKIWSPGVLDSSSLPDGWTLAYDGTHATCRLLNQPHDPDDEATQYFIIDGFVVSPGIEILSTETIDAGFEYSDHNPVVIRFKLQ